MRPFKQQPFASLPALPREPHSFFDVPATALSVTDDHFGTVTTPCRVLGSGPPLLLIHGLMTSGYSWRYALAPLSEHFTLYIPDLVGSGEADMPDVSYAPDHLADWIGAAMDALSIRGCAVIGNSMGGYLTMRLALRQPDAMARLVNLHSPGVPMLRLHALRAALSLPGSEALLRWLITRDPMRWAHQNVHYYDETLKSLEEATEYSRPLKRREGIRAFYRILKETMNPAEMPGFLAALKADFPVPLQLVYAQQDPMVPPMVGDRLAALRPDAPFVRLTEASHFAHVDATDQFVAAVLPFLLSPS
ncbi:MAG: pimeloyl-ACP methyl ester carboxylesterase [Myxococcota bacterium]|jgi:pimeloyl-ACP methyl ester carboxylesterase